MTRVLPIITLLPTVPEALRGVPGGIPGGIDTNAPPPPTPSASPKS